MSSFLIREECYAPILVFRRNWVRRLNRRLFILLAGITVFIVASLGASWNDWQSAQRKAQWIEANRWPPARQIYFSAPELLALGMSEINAAAPGAIKNAVLQLQRKGATATGIVDFDLLRRLQKSSDSSTDWLLSKLLTGQHPISVTVQVSSANGQMTVHPTLVQVSGVTLTGRTLHFMIDNFVQPHFLNSVIDRPFPLSPHLREVQVTPAYAIAIAR